jgi:CBS domain containing-hemolysin-like protein
VRVSARLGVDDLGDLFGIELEDHDVETVGGLLAERLGRVPLPGAEAEVEGLRLHAEGGKDRRGRMRITTVVVQACDERIAGRRVRVTGTEDEDHRDRSVEHA